MNDETKKDKYGIDFSETFFNSRSATDCTGLIPSLPQSYDEIESYDEVYHFLPKANVKENP